MQAFNRTSWPALAAIGSVFWLATACTPADGPTEPSDAGTDTPAADSGPTNPTAKQELESCAVGSDECDEGLLCLPGTLDPARGQCRRKCGDIVGGEIQEDPEVCSSSTTCQTVFDNEFTDTGVRVLGVVCVAPRQRDESCLALEDADACVEGVCSIDAATQNEAGNIELTSLVCRVNCTLGAAENECPQGEQCLPGANPFLDVQPDPNDESASLACDPEACTAGDASCPCAVDEGYTCTQTAGSTFICARPQGTCGEAVPVFVDDPENLSSSPQYQCNDTSDHRYCDSGPYEENGNFVLCLPLDGDDGVCLSICSAPEFDFNNDGTIDANEQRSESACLEGQVCSIDTWSLSLSNNKQCDCDDFELCDPCLGEGRCIQGQCRGVFGTCTAIAPTTETDAGVTDDAGTTSDAGSDDTSDAGTTSDAGDDNTTGGDDAGSTGGNDAGSTGGNDAGSTGGNDAGSTGGDDAGSDDSSDAGTTSDAGSDDSSDAGTTSDAGDDNTTGT